MLQKLPIILINCLFFTILIELTISLILRIKDKKDILNIILVNIATNPIVVLIPYIFGLLYNLRIRHIVLYILEIITVIFEGYIYKKYLNYKKINPYVLSFILNLSSYLIGDVINKIIY